MIKINFNMCDNSPECSGMAVCPTEAIYWDDSQTNVLGKNGTLCVNNSKCIACGLCFGSEGCPVGAITLSDSEDVDINLEKVKSLFVERYGAEPIDDSICISDITVLQDTNTVTIIESYTDSSIQCLLHSIPAASIINQIQQLVSADNIHYFKRYVEDDSQEEYPRLQVYFEKKLIAQVSGYYDDEQEQCLYQDIANQVQKNK